MFDESQYVHHYKPASFVLCYTLLSSRIIPLFQKRIFMSLIIPLFQKLFFMPIEALKFTE